MWTLQESFSFIAQIWSKMENNHIKSEQDRKVAELHWDCQHWKSSLKFLDDEMTFIERLLNSYVFEPNTPNLFERLQDYLDRLKKVNSRKKEVRKAIAKHENDLGGMLECIDAACDAGFYQKHNVMKAETIGSLDDFQNLKAEIFNYAGGILKKRKP